MKYNIRYNLFFTPPNYSIFKKMFLKLFGRKMRGEYDGHYIEGYLYKGRLFIIGDKASPTLSQDN